MQETAGMTIHKILNFRGWVVLVGGLFLIGFFTGCGQ
jgi:hypothetical protein